MSIAAPTRGILTTWEDTGSVLVVPMGEVRFIAFSNTLAIGTRGLGSCSVALVVSQHGAILAHIPPLPLEPSSPPASAQSKAESDPYAGDKNVRKMMGYVKDLYNYNRSFFPISNTHVVCALYQGEVALPDQMAIMRDVFREMGLIPVTHTYDVPGNRALPGQGTVIATSFLDGQFPSVWVEDKLVAGNFPREQAQAAMGQDRDLAPSTSSGQVTVAQQSVWSGKGKAPATWAPDLEPAAQDFGLLDIAQEPASSGKGKAPATWPYEQQMSTTGGQSVTAQVSVPGDNKYDQTQMTQVGGPTQTGRTWREVHFRVVTHLTRRDEYIFRDSNGHSRSTDRSQWHKDKYEGRSVWVFKGGRTHYFTYQKIQQ